METPEPHSAYSATGFVATPQSLVTTPSSSNEDGRGRGYATVIGNDPELPGIGRAFPRPTRSSWRPPIQLTKEMIHTAITTPSLDSRLERHVKNIEMLSISYLLLTPHHFVLLISPGSSSSMVIALFEISQRKIARVGTRLRRQGARSWLQRCPLDP